MASRRSSSRDRSKPKKDLNSRGLIYEVSKHPVIWDFNERDFHNREVKEAACDEVAIFFYGACGLY